MSVTKNDSNKLPEYYVGIGASAGGLEAIQDFVKAIPQDSNCAYIIIQHLSPDFKSMMSELLARHTNVPIHELEEGINIERGNIYLSTPRKSVMLAESKVLLLEQDKAHHHFPIDSFFRSLAEDQQNRTIAIILSGTGSDGSRGIQAIKEVGGLVIVQDPATAGFDGMPYNAISTGYSDIVCAPDEMVEKITKYSSHLQITAPILKKIDSEDATEAESNALSQIYELLKGQKNIDFTNYKGKTIIRRIERRMSIAGLQSLNEYYSYLLKEPKELQILSKDVLIGVTRFFRDPEYFEYLKNEIVTQFVKHPGEHIRVWCSCCSTGEEAYSLAIIIDEVLKENNIDKTISIFATDVDGDAIAEAGNGRYSTNIIQDISQKRIEEYFINEGEAYSVVPKIRRMVVFAVHNVMQDPPFSNCDLTSCRNALIYFQPEAQAKVISYFHFSLKREGHLFLGSSETLGEMKQYFSVVHEKYRIFQKIPNIQGPKNLITNLPSLDRQKEINKKEPSLSSLLHNYNKISNPARYTQTYESILDQYLPPSVLMSGDGDILHVFGDTGVYFQKVQSGQFKSSIHELIHENLSSVVSTAIYKARSDKKAILYENIHFHNDTSKILKLDIRLLNLTKVNNPETYLLISFIPKDQAEIEVLHEDFEDVSSNDKKLIKDLEQALREKQEHLQVTVEELQTTNEELQSSNEELLAANEELQSTNEELQSVNEELYSVNTEFQDKMNESVQANGDIENMIRSADINFIFLDEALLIRRFSKNISEDFNLLKTDIGRPFHHISHKLNYDNLLIDLANVLKTDETITLRVTNDANQNKLLKIAPYVDENLVSLGCIISITDVTEVIKLEDNYLRVLNELRSTQDVLDEKNQAKQLSVLVVDDNEVDREALIRSLQTRRHDSDEYEITVATDYNSAKEYMLNNEYDICILDYNLSISNAFELIKSVRAKGVELIVIILTGVLDQINKSECREIGVYDVLTKDELTPAVIQRSISFSLRQNKTEKYLIQHLNNE